MQCNVMAVESSTNAIVCRTLAKLTLPSSKDLLHADTKQELFTNQMQPSSGRCATDRSVGNVFYSHSHKTLHPIT